jgi:ADP-heptose:LPS heptosyltransferase
MALRAIHQYYPTLEIHFLAREKFIAAAKKVPWIHQVIEFPTENLLKPVLTKMQGEKESIRELALWIKPLVETPWDIVVNWTFSDASSYLTALLPARIKLGYTRRRDSTFAAPDGWSLYMNAVVQGQVHQNIHLTDMITTQLLTALQIHVGEPLGADEVTSSVKSFFQLELTAHDLDEMKCLNKNKWICIQLGASKLEKTWPYQTWKQLIEIVLNNNSDYGIILLGEKDSRVDIVDYFSDVLLRYSDRFMSFVGKTNFDLWAALVSHSEWIFSGDTAVIHLASIMGIKVLNLSVGNAYYPETGPYGNGHYVVTADGICDACQGEGSIHQCREIVTPDIFYKVWCYAIVADSAHPVELRGVENVRIFRSKIRLITDGGGVFYEQITNKLLTLDEWTALVMGYVARTWYCGWCPAVGHELARDRVGPELVKQLRTLLDAIQVVVQICQKSKITAESIVLKCAALKSSQVMEVKHQAVLQELGHTLSELEGLLDRVTRTHASLRGFSQMSKVLMHHLRGNSLSELSKETTEVYQQLYEGAMLFEEWIHFTLRLTKPALIFRPQEGLALL